MIEDEKIIEMFFERSEQGIRELDIKYGKVCHKLSYNIVNSRQDAEECVNDAYLGAWNAIPPANPHPLLTYICKIVRNISLKIYYRKEAAKRNSTYTIAISHVLHPRTDRPRQPSRPCFFPAITGRAAYPRRTGIPLEAARQLDRPGKQMVQAQPEQGRRTC